MLNSRLPAALLLSALLGASSLSTPCRWSLRASVGRASGMQTSMPDEWGKSGACLPFSVEVEVKDTPASESDDRVGDASMLEPVTPEIGVTGFGGSVAVPVGGGGWQVADGKLRAWLEFPEGARCSADGDTCDVWGLAPGVATQAADVELPAGRLYFETDVWEDAELEKRNKEFLAARSIAWQAQKAVTALERAKNPAPVWSSTKNAWVAEGERDSFVSEQLKRADLRKAEAAQEKIDEQRPKRNTLSQEAGRWPRDGPVRWMGRKGRLLIRRTGPFGSLPFGLGDQYTCVGTWSAEPIEAVETFWTMPE